MSPPLRCCRIPSPACVLRCSRIFPRWKNGGSVAHHSSLLSHPPRREPASLVMFTVMCLVPRRCVCHQSQTRVVPVLCHQPSIVARCVTSHRSPLTTITLCRLGSQHSAATHCVMSSPAQCRCCSSSCSCRAAAAPLPPPLCTSAAVQPSLKDWLPVTS